MKKLFGRRSGCTTGTSQRPQLAPRAGAVSRPAQIQPERAFWSRTGVSQDSLLQPEHRKMAIAPSGELTASMKVMGLLHAAHIGRSLVSRFAMRANAGQRNRFLLLFAVL